MGGSYLSLRKGHIALLPSHQVVVALKAQNPKCSQLVIHLQYCLNGINKCQRPYSKGKADSWGHYSVVVGPLDVMGW